MKLKSLILKNFRSYKEKTVIDFDSITTFIGKNDIGKSTILEALEIFFNNSIVKIDSKDLCVNSEDTDITIGCIFTDLPKHIVIDSTSTTTLEGEYLLNADGDLEIHKVYDATKKALKEKVHVSALHPSKENYSDLLTLKIKDLKKRAETLTIDTEDIDMRASSKLRKAIWNHCSDLQCEYTEIALDKEDAKKIWDNLKQYIPIYALFQSDRSSIDEDNEVQDPMKLAIEEALSSVESELLKIKETVREKATTIANETLEKLKEMDPELADTLVPDFKAEPKWNSIFKLTLDGDDEIPINKRGSGVRRLILLNFFRAQAERRKTDENSPNIIYAIEEPETSQHPNNQKMLVNALLELSEREDCQVILTTHVPQLARVLPIESIRYIKKNEQYEKTISKECDDINDEIADDLGILPDKRVQVLVCVEGSHDIEFLKHISHIMHKDNNELPDLSNDNRIAIFPLGGGTLQHWVNKRYLSGLNMPEVHIYDRDNKDKPQYLKYCDKLNGLDEDIFAILTSKREMENYLHPEAIKACLDIEVSFDDDANVPQVIADAINEIEGHKHYRINDKKTKKLLNKEVVKHMNCDLIREIDPENDITKWLEEIGKRLV